MKKRYVLKNRTRFYTIILVIFVITAATVFSTTVRGNSEADTKTTITVCSGDTLWDIAVKNREGTEIRKYIYQIKKVNSLNDSMLYKGMKIILP